MTSSNSGDGKLCYTLTVKNQNLHALQNRKRTGYCFWNTHIARSSTVGLEKIHFWFI